VTPGTPRAPTIAAVTQELQPLTSETMRLESMIASRGGKSGYSGLADAFLAATVYVLGGVDPGGETILHATMEGRVIVPAFTRIDALREAIDRQPSWGRYAVLRMPVDELIDAIDEGADVVVNPWTRLEMDYSRG
jgi:hypothetical protein